MTLSRSWQFIGPVGSVWNRLYDRLRRNVNARLVDYMLSHLGDCHTNGQQPRMNDTVAVLEAGSGTAYASTLLGRRLGGCLVVCMDSDVDALIEAKLRDSALTLVVGDLRSMPFADRSFDLVFNNSTVEHLDEPALAVTEMRRLCAPGGCVFVGVPYAAGPLCFQPAIARTKVGIWLGTVFTRNSLDGILRGAGLIPVGFVRYFLGFFIGAVARHVDSSPSAPHTRTSGC